MNPDGGFMRAFSISFLAAILVMGASAPARSQQLAEKMTCEQLIRFFEDKGVVYKTVNGKTLPVRVGIPIRQARGLSCGPNNYQRRTASATTMDKRRCIYAVYCQGFNDDRKFKNQ
jgi:hypothetical protein